MNKPEIKEHAKLSIVRSRIYKNQTGKGNLKTERGRERENAYQKRRTGKKRKKEEEKGLAVKEIIFRRRKRIKRCMHLRMSALKNITMAYSFGTKETMTRPSQRDSTTRELARKGIVSASGNSLTRRFACLSRFFSFFSELLRFFFFSLVFLYFLILFQRSTFNGP